ncbi:hypothetical protein ACMU_06650 [Actibacterium mucosum KCTC 23349]|uniref:Uncharacterized protein n=1 Tax=Actibacterium mucosum KCTC 23349 TaxID=1454373 RepID=A0A037ZKI2_9RHOB|nr:hypothetical protein [Actibacterium mucosum]KAJ56618.1 hypothetical protein ACMU_06650 [Actibacterium mucosum KCTC 23349]
MKVLILGSGPNAVAARDWPTLPYDALVAINNAWRVRDDWTHAIYPEDFPADRHPPADTRPHIRADRFVPAQNAFGGFVYAGGTMAFTAAYWALHDLKPTQMDFLGCDMVYAPTGNTHFYGTGTADPLRDDPTLQSLEAKSARLLATALDHGCDCRNLSTGPSRLIFAPATAPALRPDPAAIQRARSREAELDYFVASGRYWETPDAYDPAELRALDALWLATVER